MTPRVPTQSEMDELIEFLPKFSTEGFQAVKVPGNATLRKNVISLSEPEYDPLVCEFFEAASQEVWCDPDYSSSDAGEILRNAKSLKTASITEIQSMLTLCVRGERFCTGHWESILEGDKVRQILLRLQELRSLL